MDESKKITVCDKCFMASCWQGIFLCDEARTAGTVEMPVYKLRKLNLEHPSYWEEDQSCKK
jgi:hypothetical protein